MKKKFPKTIYVAIANEGMEKDEFFESDDDPSGFAEINTSRRVAKYQLVEVGEVRADAAYKASR